MPLSLIACLPLLLPLTSLLLPPHTALWKGLRKGGLVFSGVGMAVPPAQLQEGVDDDSYIAQDKLIIIMLHTQTILEKPALGKVTLPHLWILLLTPPSGNIQPPHLLLN